MLKTITLYLMKGYRESHNDLQGLAEIGKEKTNLLKTRTANA